MFNILIHKNNAKNPLNDLCVFCDINIKDSLNFTPFETCDHSETFLPLLYRIPNESAI